jgi:pyruvate dehydrogenase E2 component (dihydrolipoyllysine-residue acetyltransferase)
MNAAVRLVEVRVPDMGNFKDVAVIDVLVRPGESIEPEAPLVTLETEKATMDVPSTASGVIEKIHVAKGGTVSTGDLIATVRAPGEAAAGGQPVAGAPASGAATAPASTGAAAGGQTAVGTGARSSGAGTAPVLTVASQPAVASQAAGTGAGSANGVAGMTHPTSAGSTTPTTLAGGTTSAKATSNAAGAAATPSSSAGPAPTKSGATAASSSSVPPSAALSTNALAGRLDLPPINEPGFSRAHAGPSVRKFARELGVDLTRVKGSGFKGRVTHDDVKSFVKTSLTPAAATTTARAPASGGGALPAIPAVDFSQFGPIETKPLSRIQKISGPRLHASWVNIPHVTQFDEADITDLEAARNRLKDKASQAGIKLTPLAFIVRACVKAVQEFPQFNASLDPGGANLILKKYVHIGFAADTPNGLVVPVIHDADRKDIYKIARELGELSEKARAGKLSPNDMMGGCFTISSLGGIGGTAFTPIINAPEVAILGVSRSAMKPVYRDGTFTPRLMLPLSLSYDHRVIDGATAARFTTFLAQSLAKVAELIEAIP